MSLSANTVIICSTARLVRGVLLREQQQQLQAGNWQWKAPEVYTLQQWLDKMMANAMLLGILPSDELPILMLSPIAEAFLWEQAIEKCLAKHEAAALFDIRSLAKSAIEANDLMLNWQISEAEINHHFISQETRQFLRWRHTFQALCSQQNAIEPAQLTALQIALLEKYQPSFTLFNFPQKMMLEGFDRITPLENSLFEILRSRGVVVDMLIANTVQNSKIQYYALNDANAECRAAVAWAQQKLAENPKAQLAIISPVLGNIRRELADLLDDTFHPETLHASHYEDARCYDFSLGLALTEYPIVHSALRLLRFVLSNSNQANSNQSKANICFEDVTPILQDVYWGSQLEIDGRAQLDAHLRQRLNATYSLEALINQANKCHADGIQLTQLIEHLGVITKLHHESKSPLQQRQIPSHWAIVFINLLENLNWSKSKPLSSHEYQAQQSFEKRLKELSALDAILGKVTAQEALKKLVELCSVAMFQPESTGDIPIQLLGLLETPALQLDAVWALNINNQHWPPPVKLNPLLPADLQRNRGTPNASANVQTEFAALVHQRLMMSAPELVFSYALKDDELELRPSPLIAGHTLEEEQARSIQTLAEELAQPAVMQMLDDDMAPAVLPSENIRGGVKLFATQAICPAWVFYQYRLGANKLETPIDGLDNMSRGSLLHKALEIFWLSCKRLDNLKAMTDTQRLEAIGIAVEKAILSLRQEISFNLPPQILQIERERLTQLLSVWLGLELERADFEVRDCEKEYADIEIEGLKLKLTIDRIDTLTGDGADSGIVVIDYKTSSIVSNKTWADDRIAEPQLPIYAAIALKGEKIVGVCFAKIRAEEVKFIGLSEAVNVLPSVSTLAKVRSGSTFERFESWGDLLQHWNTSLRSIAREIKAGVASVTFTDEADLAYCDVKPLLRLPERLLQFENLQASIQAANKAGRNDA